MVNILLKQLKNFFCGSKYEPYDKNCLGPDSNNSTIELICNTSPPVIDTAMSRPCFSQMETCLQALLHAILNTPQQYTRYSRNTALPTMFVVNVNRILLTRLATRLESCAVATLEHIQQ
jgi:hypothetical protein